METFFAALMGIGGVTASTMCGLEFLMSKPSETREIIAYIFFAKEISDKGGSVTLVEFA